MELGSKKETIHYVTMGSFDEAKICELVDLYLLDKLSILIGRKNVGLYRDDRLAAINNINIVALFNNEGPSTTIETNLL